MRDLIGVGIGPFNLGLAALLDPVDDVDAVFFDRRPEFSWHAGLMLADARVQVPFLADLVTLADPTSPHSVLQYLHEHGRLYRFYFREQMHLLRREFDAYCRWVAGRLDSCRFGHEVDQVRRDGDAWVVEVTRPDGGREEHRARNVVLGVGTVPAVPAFARDVLGDGVFHSCDYMTHRERARAAGRVAVIGSGQSAAEVFLDLLEAEPAGGAPMWFTRGPGFLPMEYSKLGLEFFSPEYTAHFHSLSEERRDAIRAGQDPLYKGIDMEASGRIYDRLYALSVDGDERADRVEYRGRCELRHLEASRDGGWTLGLHHLDDGADFGRGADIVILATGYEAPPLPVHDLTALVEHDTAGRPVVERDFRLHLRDGRPSTLFVQNAELHTHGVGTPDLGLAAHRNSVIVNAVADRAVYPVRERNVFQRFGVPR